MKHLNVVILFLLLSWMVAAGTAFASEQRVPAAGLPVPLLDLETACRLTLQGNPDLAQAEARIDGAAAVLQQACSAWKPVISATADATAIQATAQPDWQPNIRVDEAYNQYDMTLQIGWRLFDGFSRQANILAAKHGVSRERMTLQEIRRRLVQATAVTYLQARLSMENMTIAHQNKAFNQRLERDAKIRWEVGTAAEAEMLNFSVRALQAQSDYLKALQAFNLTGTALTRLMALPEIRLTPDMFPTSESQVPSLLAGTYETALETAAATRPDIKALDQAMAALKEKMRAAKGGFYPEVSLVSGMEYLFQQEKAGYDEEEHNTYAGVHVSWDLYTGGRLKAGVKKIAADLARVREERRAALIRMKSDIREALDSVETTRATWENQKKTREMSRKVRNHVEKAYRAGVATLTRLNEAQTDLVRASGAAAAARIQYAVACINLNAAMGTPLGNLMFHVPSHQP